MYALDLATHGEEEENEEVDDEDGPVHRHVEHLEERAHDRDRRCARRREPARRHVSARAGAMRGTRRTRTATRAAGERTA